MTDTPEDIARDISAIGRIDAVPLLLRVICELTGMGFAAVARVTEGSWTVCAVKDDIAFGLKPGGQLDVHSTLCKEVRQARVPVVIDQASTDAVYFNHHTPRIYGIESYISVPIVLPDGEYFGNLCAIDPRPARLSEPRIIDTFKLFAELIAAQLNNDRQHQRQAQLVGDQQAMGASREQFIAVLGHDLRNPLSAIATTAHLLRARGDTMTQDLASRIGRQVQRMAKMIDETLDLARSRLGGGIGVVLHDEPAMAAAINDVVNELCDANPVCHVNATVEVPVNVRCDRGRVQQLVSNLLANAVQHGAPGTPVNVRAVVEGPELVISVNNQGEVIPPSAMAHLFEPFQRGELTSSRKGAGLGLGLYIASQIAKAHGGSLAVQSTPEQGTSFVARLLLQPAERVHAAG